MLVKGPKFMGPIELRRDTAHESVPTTSYVGHEGLSFNQLRALLDSFPSRKLEWLADIAALLPS